MLMSDVNFLYRNACVHFFNGTFKKLNKSVFPESSRTPLMAGQKSRCKLSMEFKSLTFVSFFCYTYFTMKLSTERRTYQVPTHNKKWSRHSNPLHFKQRIFLHTRGQKANENVKSSSACEQPRHPRLAKTQGKRHSCHHDDEV